MTELSEPVRANMRPYSEVALLRALRAWELVREPDGGRESWDLNAVWLAGEIGCTLRVTVRALERLCDLGEVVETEAKGWDVWHEQNGLPTPRGARRFRLSP